MQSTLRTDNLLQPDTAIAYAVPSLVPQHSVPGLNEVEEVEVDVALSYTPCCEHSFFVHSCRFCHDAKWEQEWYKWQSSFAVCGHPLTDEGDWPSGSCPYCRDEEAYASMWRKMEEEFEEKKRTALDNSCRPPEGNDFDARKRNGERAHQNRLVKKGKNSKRHFDNFEWQEARRVAMGKPPRSNPRDKHDHRTNKAATQRRADWESDHPSSTIGVGARRIPNAQHLQRATARRRNPRTKPYTDEDKFDVNGYRAFDDETFFHHTEEEEILLDVEAVKEAQEAAYAAHIAYECEMRKACDLEVLHNLVRVGAI